MFGSSTSSSWVLKNLKFSNIPIVLFTRHNLKVVDWFGETVPFGTPVKYMCDRNTYHQDDRDWESFQLTCQEENVRGYFNVPENDGDWPKCILSVNCTDPPEPPLGGNKVSFPAEFSIQKFSSCAVEMDSIHIKCPSFLSILILETEYGRHANDTYMCDGTRSKAPTANCLSSEFLEDAQTNCHGEYECSSQVPMMRSICGVAYKPQLSVNYTCAQCFPWHELVTEDDQCIEDILIFLKQLTQDEIDTFSIKEKGDVLKQYVRKILNDDYYTKTKLKHM